MKMKQVMSHNINNGLLNMIRRTDPMIIHGEGYGYNEVEEVIKELFGK